MDGLDWTGRFQFGLDQYVQFTIFVGLDRTDKTSRTGRWTGRTDWASPWTGWTSRTD